MPVKLELKVNGGIVKGSYSLCIWAFVRENQTLLQANKKGAAQLEHLQSLISAYVIRYWTYGP